MEGQFPIGLSRDLISSHLLRALAIPIAPIDNLRCTGFLPAATLAAGVNRMNLSQSRIRVSVAVVVGVRLCPATLWLGDNG